MVLGGTSLLPAVKDVVISPPTATGSGAMVSVGTDVIISHPTATVSGDLVSVEKDVVISHPTASVYGDLVSAAKDVVFPSPTVMVSDEMFSAAEKSDAGVLETLEPAVTSPVAQAPGAACLMGKESAAVSPEASVSVVAAPGAGLSPGLAQRTWANVVQRKSALEKFDVSVSVVEGKSTVAVPDEILEDSPPLWEDFLVGRFPSEAPHVAKIHVIVNKIWNLGDKSIRIDVFKVNDKTVKFRIRHASARQRVLRRSMWNICDLPMVVSKWTPIAEDAQPEIKTMSMWMTIKNVPNSMFTWKGLSYLASPVGIPKRLHPETEQVVNFDEAKIFVEVDMMKELPKTYYFQIKGMEFGVSFEYPWLPPRCGICGKWGHLVENCLANVGSAAGKSSVPLPGLLVEPRFGSTNCSQAVPIVVEERTASVVATDA